MSTEDPQPQEKVGFRDIYRAVGESESRIKEHITLILLPITSQIADHEVRIRSVETYQAAQIAGGVERRRIGGITNKALVAAILVSNFIIGVVMLVANAVTGKAA